MNTYAEYRRHAPQPPVPGLVPAQTPEAAQQFSMHGDPSLGPQQPGATTATGRRIAWVRPTELHAYAEPMIGRGIDLHAELARRSRRTPNTVARSARRAAPLVAGPRPAAPSATREGMGL